MALKQNLKAINLDWKEGDCISIAGCTRQSFNSDFKFYLSILITDASPLEIPNWFLPVEIWGGYNYTNEITSGIANHRIILIYKSLEARGTYCSLQAKGIASWIMERAKCIKTLLQRMFSLGHTEHTFAENFLCARHLLIQTQSLPSLQRIKIRPIYTISLQSQSFGIITSRLSKDPMT